MAHFHKTEYQTRFRDHCKAISELLALPIDPYLVATYDSYLVHVVAQTRVLPKKQSKLDTHIKLWLDWESTIYTSERVWWFDLSHKERVDLCQ
jgi:hypothetical protein